LSEKIRYTVTRQNRMAGIIAGTAAVLGLGVAMRTGLRSAVRNGAKLSPLMQRIAGETGPAGPSSRFGKAPNGQEWVLGGFQARMDRKEASEILGLR
jgi:DnaJ family protein C protein 19